MLKLVELYLKHIGVSIEEPSFQYLCELQKKHIEHIPHENIDGIFNIHSSFDIPYLLNKYVNENRGGMCFELNYSFAWLLNQLGFEVEIILANVIAYEHHKENNKYPTHPVIFININDNKFLTDVGWCDSYRNPISLTMEEYRDQTGTYRVINTTDKKLIMQKRLESQDISGKYGWYDQFVFNKPNGPSEKFSYPEGFLAAHAYTHIGNGYLFTNLFKFTRVKNDGNCTIWGDKLLTRNGVEKKCEPLKKDIPTTLQDDFNVAPNIAKKCVKLSRSLSMLFPYKPIDEDAVIDKAYLKVRLSL